MSHGAAYSNTAPWSPTWLSRVLAQAVPERVLRGRNVSKADVSLYRIEGRAVAVKDYAARPFLARHTVGRLMARRECNVYERLGSLPGLAPFLGRLSPFAFATTWIESTPLADLPGNAVSAQVFDGLDGLIKRLHQRGVALSDLHHRDVLVGADATVHVVDLAAAFILGDSPGPVRRRVFARLALQDKLAAARMRARFTGGDEHEALASIDRDAVRMWEVGRGVKRLWDRLRGRRD